MGFLPDFHSAMLAVIMGIVEGTTEFLPVSSTGHLILAARLLHFEGPASEVFEVVIQLGAILAVCLLYFTRLWNVVTGLLKGDAAAKKFTLAVALAFLPAAVIGLVMHDFIKQYLFNVWVVCTMLIVGGFLMLLVEKFKPAPTVKTVEAMGWKRALEVGFFQCLAMVPGVSRSGATILGAMWAGVDRKTATEFSFFLAIPTMLGASVLDLWKARHALGGDSLGLIAIGFVVSFVVAMLVVNWLVNFISRHTFASFAWYRIALGCAGILLLMVGF